MKMIQDHGEWHIRETPTAQKFLCGRVVPSRPIETPMRKRPVKNICPQCLEAWTERKRLEAEAEAEAATDKWYEDRRRSG